MRCRHKNWPEAGAMQRSTRVKLQLSPKSFTQRVST